MKPSIVRIVRIASVWLALLALPWAMTPASAQSTLTARSFSDLSDTTDATTDNDSVSTAGSLLSIIARLKCLIALNPLGNTANVTLNVQKGAYRIYNP